MKIRLYLSDTLLIAILCMGVGFYVAKDGHLIDAIVLAVLGSFNLFYYLQWVAQVRALIQLHEREDL